MKSILITGGSHAEIPLINALHSLGYRVISTGLNECGLGHRVADIYEHADFSDKIAMLNLAKKYRVSGIVSGCNDFAYLSSAFVATELGFSGYDNPCNAYRIHHKSRFRELQKACGILYPRFLVCKKFSDLETAKSILTLPVVVKPVDLTGGKGVVVCFTWQDVKKQYFKTLKVSRESSLVVEEYVLGKNHGTSMLLRKGKVIFSFFDNEEYFQNKYLVSGAYSPSDLSSMQKADVISQVEKLAQYACLCDGLFHCQFITNGNGQSYLIDPCRRAPGDLYIQLVKYATGIDYPMAIVKGQLGLPLDHELNFKPLNRCIARECMMASTNGVIKQIYLHPDYESHIIEKVQWLFAGDRIHNHLVEKAGIVFFEYPSAEELRSRMKTLRENMRVDILL